MTQRVLVTGAANIGKAGVATIVYKWGQEFDPDVLVYDYLMQSGLPDEQYQQAIREKGGVMYTSDTPMGMLDIVHWVEERIRENRYEVLHINSDSAYIAAAYIYAAKKAGIRDIYVHSHCTQIDDTNKLRRTIKTVLHKLCVPYVNHNTKLFLACSQVAGQWMFGRKNACSDRYQTIYNGVEVEKYLFDPTVRQHYRAELGLEGKYVMGNVGRFSYQKNHAFLLKAFAAYVPMNPDAHLVLVGAGELQDSITAQIKKLGLEARVSLLGTRNDIPALLSTFDVMVMPSRFEGLPVTMVEAQMADLPCVVADTITREAKFSDNVDYVSGWDPRLWAQRIHIMKDYVRTGDYDAKRNSRFNITQAAKELEEILLGQK